jgi:Domain of unknown function (DUF4124)
MMKFVIILIILAFISPAYAATIYKWVDKEGVVNFTDDYNNVPSSYRDRLEIKHYLTEGVAPAYTSEVPPQKRAEAKTDLYGRDETWWRDEVRPWREQLKEATANYERFHEKFMAKAEELSERRFGSRTQYKANIIQLDQVKEEMFKYEDQIAEAKEMLEKLSKEAKETKADPAWLD